MAAGRARRLTWAEMEGITNAAVRYARRTKAVRQCFGVPPGELADNARPVDGEENRFDRMTAAEIRNDVEWSREQALRFGEWEGWETGVFAAKLVIKIGPWDRYNAAVAAFRTWAPRHLTAPFFARQEWQYGQDHGAIEVSLFRRADEPAIRKWEAEEIHASAWWLDDVDREKHRVDVEGPLSDRSGWEAEVRRWCRQHLLHPHRVGLSDRPRMDLTVWCRDGEDAARVRAADLRALAWWLDEVEGERHSVVLYGRRNVRAWQKEVDRWCRKRLLHPHRVVARWDGVTVWCRNQTDAGLVRMFHDEGG